MTTSTTSLAPSRTTTVRRVVVVVAAAVFAVVLRWLLAAVAGTDFTVRSGADGPARPVGPGAVVIVALVVGLLAWGLLALLERTTGRGRVIWTWIAVPLLVVSLLGPLGGVAASDKLSLLALHLVVGVTLILGLPAARRAAGRRSSAS
jgi:hypothetical protein